MARIKQVIQILTNSKVPWSKKWYWLRKQWNDNKIIDQCVNDFIEKQKGGPGVLQSFHENILKSSSRVPKIVAL